MAVTRRTPAFDRLAQRTRQLLGDAAAQVTDEQIDAVLNYRIEQVAARIGVAPRTALRYAPADLPQTTAHLIVDVLAAGSSSAADAVQAGTARTRRHLRLVESGAASPSEPPATSG